MCIAIYKPKGKKIHRDVLEECFRMNRDGAGFSFHDPEAEYPVALKKGYFTFNDFWEAYEKFSQSQKLACIIHFRVATHKNVDGRNCHPWRVSSDLVFIHNGTIPGMTKDDSLSDTGNFCAMLDLLMQEAPTYYKTPEFKWFISNAIGGNNKLIFLDKDGDHIIINESAGVWKDGCWFSNQSFSCSRSRGKGVLTDDCYPDEPVQEKTAPKSTPVNIGTNLNTNTNTSNNSAITTINTHTGEISVEKAVEAIFDPNGDGVKVTMHTLTDLDDVLRAVNAVSSKMKVTA